MDGAALQRELPKEAGKNRLRRPLAPRRSPQSRRMVATALPGRGAHDRLAALAASSPASGPPTDAPQALCRRFWVSESERRGLIPTVVLPLGGPCHGVLEAFRQLHSGAGGLEASTTAGRTRRPCRSSRPGCRKPPACALYAGVKPRRPRYPDGNSFTFSMDVIGVLNNSRRGRYRPGIQRASLCKFPPVGADAPARAMGICLGVGSNFIWPEKEDGVSHRQS